MYTNAHNATTSMYHFWLKRSDKLKLYTQTNPYLQIIYIFWYVSSLLFQYSDVEVDGIWQTSLVQWCADWFHLISEFPLLC